MRFPGTTRLDINIQDNVKLETITGFDVLTHIERRLSINRNAKLTTLSAFSALESVGDFISISDNTLTFFVLWLAWLRH